jgi:nucleoside-diphosphate-sugar epimerase
MLLQEMMIEPAIRGTRYVMTAVADTGVKRVVFTSSIGTVYMNPYRDPNRPVDDTCWSDLEYCKNTQVHTHASWVMGASIQIPTHSFHFGVLRFCFEASELGQLA